MGNKMPRPEGSPVNGMGGLGSPTGNGGSHFGGAMGDKSAATAKALLAGAHGPPTGSGVTSPTPGAGGMRSPTDKDGDGEWGHGEALATRDTSAGHMRVHTYILYR